MTAVEVCAVCELPHPCPSGHNCGALTREVPEHIGAVKPVSKSRKNEPEVRGGESRGDWDPAVTEPEDEPLVYESDNLPPLPQQEDPEDGE